MQSLDWGQFSTGVQSKETFDIVIGSDLVYHEEIVTPLVQTLSVILRDGGRFYHVASQQRNSLVEFKEAMERPVFMHRSR